MLEIERLLANKPQRPPMVSTLAMRNQQNTVRIDMPSVSYLHYIVFENYLYLAGFEIVTIFFS